MLKVTFLLTNIYKEGGVQRVITTLANTLSKKNIEVTVLSVFKTNNEPVYKLNSTIKVDYIFIGSFSLKKKMLLVIKSLKDRIETSDIDILIFSGMFFGLLVKIATLTTKNIKTIAWEHQQFHFGKKYGLDWVGKRISSKYMDAIVVLTADDYNTYINHFNDKDNIFHIYNPAEIDLSTEPYNFENKKIISVGSLVHRKGFDYAVEVAQKIFFEYPDWSWEIYGEGPERTRLENMVEKYGLQNNLYFKGYSDNMYQKYKDFSIFVMTSRNEGLGMVLIEAKSNKLPIVSFDCKSGPRELISDNINGNLITNFNIEQMSGKLIEIMGNKELALHYSQNSFKDLKKFNKDTVTDNWLNLFDSLYTK